MESKDPNDSVQNEQFGTENSTSETTQNSSTVESTEEKADIGVTNTDVEMNEDPEPAITEVEPLHVNELDLQTPYEIAGIEEDDEENIDPSNILEGLDEHHHDHNAPEEDYSQFSKTELIHKLSNLLTTKNVEKIRTSVDSIKINFYKKHKAEQDKIRKDAEEAGSLAEGVEMEFDIDPLEETLKDLLKKYRDLKTEYNQKLEQEKVKNLQEKYKIIDEIKELVNCNESINDTFHQFRELQNKWRTVGIVPQSNLKDLWETYHHYVEIFYDYIKINKELRDLDLKKNFEAKMEICEKAEELLLEPSIIKAFKTLQKLHEAWRETGPVPQESKVEIWERFKAITSKLNKKHQDYFEGLKSTQKKNYESKVILCEKAEEICNVEIKSPKDWEHNYQEMIELQKIWRTIGFAPKKDNNKIYNRFRAACDGFFNRKREFFAQTKEEQSNNLQLKTDLCIQAESLKESNEWKATTEDLINLQKKWKQIGTVPRKHSDLIWKRFRAACDYFFNRKAQYFNNIDSQYDENLKLKLELIAEIENFVAGDQPEENFQKLKEFQRRWAEIGFVPLKQKEEIQKKYRDAINKQFDNLKIDDSKKNMMRFKNKIENISTKTKGGNKLRFEREKYISKLKQVENDIVVWENNIGFFAKSKNAESMIAEVQRKIQAGKEEIKTIEEKVRMIDAMDDDE
jgi:hypothetical protein